MKIRLLLIAFICIIFTKTIHSMSEMETYEGDCEGEVENPETFSPEDKLFHGAIHSDLDLVIKAYNQLVNLNIQDEQGNTALMLINYNKRKATSKAIAKFLLDLGADPNIKNYLGCTALMYVSIWSNNKNIVQLLLNAKANPDIQNNHGDTALIMAAANNNKEIVQPLLNANADIDIKNNENKTALDIAQENGHFAIAQILQNEQIKRRNIVKKETGKHLPKDLAIIVSEFFASCPEASDKKPEKPA